MIIDVDCRAKDSKMGGGQVLSCNAKSGTNQIFVEGSPLSAAVYNMQKVLPGGERIASKERRLARHTALPVLQGLEDKIKDKQSHVLLS